MKQYLNDGEIKDVSKGVFSDYQIDAICLPTPPEEIEEIEEDGRKYKSVKGQYIKKRLNIIFAFNWDFQIISKEYFKEEKIVLIQGRLIIRTNGTELKKEQFGKFKVQSPFDLGNSFKSASTDALKKCASEIGICWDIYSQESETTPTETKQTPEERQKAYDLLKKEETLEEFLKMFQNDENKFDEFVEKFLNESEATETEKGLIKLYKLKFNK